ncbi:MAG: transporter substrate-binding protein [Paenibacillus sp.]|nr:transporter substrate-binding protein [Paenibacillus sp.]
MRQRNASLFIIAIMTLMLVLVACGGANKAKGTSGETNASQAEGANGGAQQPTSRSVKDDYGREIDFPTKPQRLIAPGFEDMLIVLGMKPVAQYALGTEVKEHLQPWLAGVPPIDYTGGLKPEPVMSLNPDLLILSNSGWMQGNAVETFSKIAPTYLFNEESTGTNNWANNWRGMLRRLGELFDKKEVAEQVIADYEQKAKEAKARIHQKIGDKKVLILYLAGKSLGMMGTGWWNSAPVLYEDLGLAAPEVAKGKGYASLSAEMIPQLDADYIFVIMTNPNEALETNPLLDNALWRDLPAVKAGRVFKVGRDSSFFGSGPITNKLTIEAVEKALTK